MPKISDAQQQARRQEILEAVFRCLAGQGYSRMSVRDIAGEAGISVGTLYLYFKDKDEMVSALMEQAHAQNAAVLEGQQSGEGGLETLLGILGFLVRSLDDSASEQTVRVDIQLWSEALHHGTLRALVERVLIERSAQFSDLIRAAQAEKKINADIEPEGLARLLVAMLAGLELQRAIQPDFAYDSLLQPLKAMLMPSPRG